MENSYQSPISLDHENRIKIHKKIHIEGINRGSKYNSETKNFEVKDNVIITVGKKRYRLEEYHFHVRSEHKVNGEFYPAEIHYVFIEIEFDDNTPLTRTTEKCHNLCQCTNNIGSITKLDIDTDIIVIGRVILDVPEYKNLDILQVKVPHFYYEYDGTLTTGNYTPIRWIVGETPIHFDLRQLEQIAKAARPIQELDGRIVLYSYPKSQ